mmetsp:Transcript_11155/g.13212  ORF Transcript_11155/g.13212 Transcript_11155/m.13212 type:complete len:545 (+) Transcript_11155:1-1635(+)
MSDRVEDVGSYVTTEVRPGIRNPRDYIFGVNCPISLESAAKEAVSRGGMITVYVVGTNTLQLELISKLFAVIPSRIYLMRSSDFFNAYERGNTSIEVDRLAALRGSAHCKGFPSLLFDAGEFLTYTAADSKARVLGGGISAGLLLRVNSMSGKSGDLDHITSKDLDKILEGAANSKKPLPIFSDNTEESVVSAALSEVSCHIRHVVKMWLEKVGLPRDNDECASTDISTFGKVNNRRVISIIGKNAMVIEKMLQSNNGGLIESFGSELQINTSVSNHFIPDGIQSAISRQSMLTKNNDEQSIITLSSTSSRGKDTLGIEEANGELSTVISNMGIGTTARRSEIDFINKRVSKKVQVSGNNCGVKHGVVDSVTNTFKIDLYSIKFDDGSSDQASLKMVTEMRQLYKKIENSESKRDETSKKITITTPMQNVSIGQHSSAAKNFIRKRGRPKKEPIPNNLSDEREDEQPMKKKKYKGYLDEVPHFYIDKKVAKMFDLVLYYGKVKSCVSKRKDSWWWQIEYEDGDKEEFNARELEDALKLFQTHPK